MKMVAASAAALAAAGLGAWILLADSPAEADKSGPAASSASRSAHGDDDDGPAAAPSGDLDRRVAALESEVKSLRRQLALVQGARAAFAGGGDDDDEVDEAAIGGGEAPAFDSAVREIYEEERAREREERDERRREQWEARTEETLDELVADAGLDATQREAISEAWTAEREKLTPLFREARDGERDFREVREEAEAILAATDAEMQKQLSTDQYEKYVEARPRGPGRGRGEGRGRGGGSEGRGPRDG